MQPFYSEWTFHALVGALSAAAGVLGHRAWTRRRWRRPPAGVVSEAVLVVDLVDSTKLATHYGEGAAMRARNFLEEKMLDRARSRDVTFVENTGDGCLSMFPSVSAAVKTVAALMRRLERSPEDLSPQAPMSIRAAVTFGEVLLDRSGKRHGTAINKAFRLMSVQQEAFVSVEGEPRLESVPEQNRIFLDEDAANELAPEGADVRQVGVCRLKGFSGFHRVYAMYGTQP